MIRILTDSAADLTAKDAAAIPGLHIVPLNVLFENGDTIRDGVDMTRAEFYDRLAGAEKLPVGNVHADDKFGGKGLRSQAAEQILEFFRHRVAAQKPRPLPKGAQSPQQG